MKECLVCGKGLPPRAKGGHRERDYCSDVCRQRASRARNKDKHNLDRIHREMDERISNAVYQDIYKEHWQEKLEAQDLLINSLLKEIEWLLHEAQYHKNEKEVLDAVIKTLQDVLEEKEGEIARLNYLLNSKSKQRS